jgi:hypothetical protein
METITGKRGVSIALDAIVGSGGRRYAYPSGGEMRGKFGRWMSELAGVQRITGSPVNASRISC